MVDGRAQSAVNEGASAIRLESWVWTEVGQKSDRRPTEVKIQYKWERLLLKFRVRELQGYDAAM